MRCGGRPSIDVACGACGCPAGVTHADWAGAVREGHEAADNAELILALVRQQADEDDGVLVLFTEVDFLLRRGLFATCDAVLEVDVGVLPVVYLLALLSITHAACDRLLRRTDFARRVRERLMRDDPDRAEALLAGLE